LPWPIAASWSSLIVIFGVMREVRQWERYLLHCDARKQKRVMNKNLNPVIRNFLVFEKYLLMPSRCDTLFS
jgi:hypothetical protein